MPGQGQITPGSTQRAASVASNVRYEDGVVCNAPGYEKVVISSDILTGLVAHWNLDELSGPRADDSGNLHALTAVLDDAGGSVGTDPGKFKTAARFPALSATTFAISYYMPAIWPANAALTGAFILAAGGVAPYLYSVSAGSLPTGLILNSDGTVTGTPTVPGSYSFTLRAKDADNETLTQVLSIVILTPVTLAFTPPSAGEVELAASLAFTPGGGVGPYVLSNPSGTIPPGLALSGTAISGTPTTAGTYNFTVRATDSYSQTCDVSVTWVINPNPWSPGAWTITNSGAASSNPFTGHGTGVLSGAHGSIDDLINVPAGGDGNGTANYAGNKTVNYVGPSTTLNCTLTLFSIYASVTPGGGGQSADSIFSVSVRINGGSQVGVVQVQKSNGNTPGVYTGSVAIPANATVEILFLSQSGSQINYSCAMIAYITGTFQLY